MFKKYGTNELTVAELKESINILVTSMYLMDVIKNTDYKGVIFI